MFILMMDSSITISGNWREDLVDKTMVAYSTQKQDLNALVFFFREVCDYEEISVFSLLIETD